MRAPDARFSARLGVLVLAALMSACTAAPRTLGPGPTATARLTFDLESRWSPIWRGEDPEVDVSQLTVHGPLLDRFFIAAIEPGHGLVTPGFGDYPRWWAGTPADALDGFFTESLTALGYRNIEIAAKRPRPLGDASGVEYTLRLERPGGLKINGLALASVESETLDLFLFLAPREHYFEARRAEIEAVFNSAARRPRR
ncbi:MAG: hypothetical protein ACFE0P_14275 [Oceanicaulis sp.]